ncbi:MAG: PDZ domain-containing protein [Deltaproteobacteria bacterium]|nr:PDZ domain-containing protein [Deltaproteobacteria bacterium]
MDEHDLLIGALNGMLQELDPHSGFLDDDAYREMQVDTRGEFHGLGIEITKRQGEPIEVVSPIDGTPADRAGIRARDRIVMICPTERPEDWTEDCRGTKNMSLLEAVHLMRGRKGSEITIHILRKDFDEPRPFTVVTLYRGARRREARQCGRQAAGAGLRLPAHQCVPGANGSGIARHPRGDSRRRR